ncbi:MAG TPA: hypothetical protein VEC36_06660 [Patescibacteria group bacterium]|nr:hypothetical protein [Patescibacteria group bacterium]
MKWYPFLEHTILDYLEEWKPLRFFSENYSDPEDVNINALRYHLRCLHDNASSHLIHTKPKATRTPQTR